MLGAIKDIGRGKKNIGGYMMDSIETVLNHSWSLCEPYAKTTNPDFRLGSKVIYDEELFVKEPLVSVLVLTWRHEKFIEECVSSICSQVTDFPFEVLVGEDASPDGTLDACLELQKRYPKLVKIIYSEKNVGLVGNMVRLNDMARGNYIAICEGDDYWVDERKLNKQVALLKARDDVSLVHMAVWQQYEKCKWSRCPVTHKTIKRLVGMNQMPPLMQRRKMLLEGNFIQTPTVMCRKIPFTKACQELCEVEQRTHWIPSTDFMLWFLTVKSGRACFLPDIVAVKRINGSSLTMIADKRISNARILGDKRNALVMSEMDDAPEDYISELISSLEKAMADCTRNNKRECRKSTPLIMLCKRLVIMLARI